MKKYTFHYGNNIYADSRNNGFSDIRSNAGGYNCKCKSKIFLPYKLKE